MTQPDTAPRNGEILVARTQNPPRAARKGRLFAVDAEFEDAAGRQAWERDSALKTAAVAETSTPIMAREAALGQLQSLSGNGAKERQGLSGPARYGLACAAILCVFWFSGGHALLRAPLPAAQGVVMPGAGIEIVGLDSRVSTLESGKQLILVNGTVRNEGAGAAGVPPIAVRVAEASGAARRYVFGTEARLLGGGESYQFAFRLDAPESAVDKLTVEFSREP